MLSEVSFIAEEQAKERLTNANLQLDSLAVYWRTCAAGMRLITESGMSSDTKAGLSYELKKLFELYAPKLE